MCDNFYFHKNLSPALVSFSATVIVVTTYVYDRFCLSQLMFITNYIFVATLFSDNL